mmetsp:Transcript_14769/g.23095  ORF Transcript_14769/g.23095 Transcript_14769/m.23095 type:complete len:211 (-) Transcript_14769:333-965(-)|eukprot:CAMPEP_0195292878 /NCGR_PEP_ID=MMETSP0707-20130614/11101_1 /TAXON_ID=33640 /ORGANISM="Asterionellopsis glacialis, Strain CCMP134" /LENGTH=210 /DNA_ID=CAMNT_0040353463 /DNA_START=108 /DNA_END=740 /DNA_ORIENTATION=+
MFHHLVTEHSAIGNSSNLFPIKCVVEQDTEDTGNDFGDSKIQSALSGGDPCEQPSSTEELTEESLTDEELSSYTDEEESSMEDDEEEDDDDHSTPTTVPHEIFCVHETSPGWVQEVIHLRKLCFVPCNHCGNDILSEGQPQRCPDCHVTYYCSPMCQIADTILTGHGRTECPTWRQNMPKALLQQLRFRRFPPNLLEYLTAPVPNEESQR